MEKIDTFTRRYILCPICKKSEHIVEHLFEGNRNAGPWSCHTCGAVFFVKADDGQVWIEVDDKKLQVNRVLLLLNNSEKVHVEIESYYQDDQDRNEKYLWEEHHCPSNIFQFSHIVFHGTDDDFHGLFSLVDYKSVPLNFDPEKSAFNIEEYIIVKPVMDS